MNKGSCVNRYIVFNCNTSMLKSKKIGMVLILPLILFQRNEMWNVMLMITFVYIILVKCIVTDIFHI